MLRALLCPTLATALLLSATSAFGASSAEPPKFDVLILNGTLYDGGGGEGKRVDVAVRGDRIAAVGNYQQASARLTIDARGLAVAPGFINMLSWSTESLIADGR